MINKTFSTMPQVYYGVPQIYHQPLRIIPAPITTVKRLTLTPREEEVMLLLGDSTLDYAAIACKLVISRRTLEKHVESIFFKLGVTRRFQAVQVYRSGE